MIKKITCNILLVCTTSFFAQPVSNGKDTLRISETPFLATFNSSNIVNSQSVETINKKRIVFSLIQRFGNIYNSTIQNALSEAGHNIFGLESLSDIRFAIDYGLTNNITIGLGRSSNKEMIDGTFKWKFVNQYVGNNFPVSICFYGNAGYSAMTTENIYNGTIKPKTNELHRLQYCSQLLIAKSFNESFSLQVMPTYVYRNFIKQQLNVFNGKEEKNGMFSIGIGGKIRLNKKLSALVDYFYNFSEFQTKNPFAYYNVLGLGLEVKSGKNVFHINVTNGSSILESSFLTTSNDSWRNGQIKLGFNISRWYNL
jgi:hypothetical protein